MNQDQVKEKLGQIHESPVEYTLLFSGKKSGRVNGHYKPSTAEIIIHNKNFVDENGNQNESLLMVTAIHELAHHVLIAERGNKSPRAHGQDFWATFHGLLDIAEEKGIYRPAIDEATEKLINEARDIDRQIAELQRRLGKVLVAIHESSRKNGLRPEDMIERRAQISRQSTKVAVTAFYMGDQGVGADIQVEAAKQRGEDKRAAILSAGREGKSVVQAKKTTAPARPVDGEDETVVLAREKQRIERTIDSLTCRLEEINGRLFLVTPADRNQGPEGYRDMAIPKDRETSREPAA